jgi:hypothetical protein
VDGRACVCVCVRACVRAAVGEARRDETRRHALLGWKTRDERVQRDDKGILRRYSQILVLIPVPVPVPVLVCCGVVLGTYLPS